MIPTRCSPTTSLLTILLFAVAVDHAEQQAERKRREQDLAARRQWQLRDLVLDRLFHAPQKVRETSMSRAFGRAI